MNLDIIDNRKSEFAEAVEHFKQELAALRTGRASASLVEHIQVEYYGTMSELFTIAQITIPEPRQIAITPYDKNALKDIEKAIQQSSIGINPVNDGAAVRLNIPPMTEERRKEIAKVVNQMAEKARVAIRNIREDVWKEIQKMEKEGTISEDDKISGKDELQEVVDKHNLEIKKLAETKEQEIMTI